MQVLIVVRTTVQGHWNVWCYFSQTCTHSTPGTPPAYTYGLIIRDHLKYFTQKKQVAKATTQSD